jgi:hypothetical protein
LPTALPCPAHHRKEKKLVRKFRKGAVYARPEDCRRTINRNERAAIIYCAEQRELRTKGKGQKSGIIGQTGIRVLRCLLFQFHNTTTGQCDPSYTAIQARTGLCRGAVADALQRLEIAGVIQVIRRIVRSGWRVVQTTNAYIFQAADPKAPPSLDNRKEPPVKLLYPYKRQSPLLSVPLSKALEALGERIAAREACS